MSEIPLHERLATALADRYAIERELGQGGMATVYLAQDLKHHRQVAIKVLKPELAAVLGAERFVQEITTTAQLQHPNILPLFDSGRAAADEGGQGRAEFLYYVMPYVEGETLRQKLNRDTQLGIDEAVKITTEVADALQYAHAHGVVHRDIKPENILLHAGRPMVADFGIALAVSAAAGGRMTETGLSLGTPHYMSPEQATADKTITNRSDIYSLASVLYEMLTGNPPHMGSSAQQIIMKIIAEPVQPVTALRKSVPPNLAAALGQALEKLPADRFESAKAFGDALTNVSFTAAGSATRMVTAGAYRPRRALIALAALSVLASAAALWGWLRPTPAPPMLEHVVLGTFDRPGAAAIAPDGSAIVYPDTVGGVPRIWLKQRGVLQARPLAPFSPNNPPALSFSPDGQWIVYVSDGKVVKISRQGSSPIQLSDSAASSRVAWLDDGTIVFIDAAGASLFALPAGGGPARRVYRTSATLVSITAVPGARAVLVSALAGTARAFAVDLSADSAHALGVNAGAAWVVRGTLVYVTTAGQLLAVPFDTRHLTARGAPASMLQGIRTVSGLPDATVGRDGTLLYAEGAAELGGRARVTSLGRDGRIDTTAITVLSSDGTMSLSPDGSRLAISVADSATGNGDLFVIRLATGVATRLTFTGTINIRPAWSPSGTTIAYVSYRGAQAGLWTKRADGSGEASRVKLLESRPVFGVSWSPDGKWLVYRTDQGAKGNGDILAVPTSGDSTPVPLVASGARELTPVISPDGHWLAYASDASGRLEIYVKPFPNVSAGMWQVSSDGGSEPLWSHSGREIFYRNARGDLVAVAVTTTPTFSPGAHTTLLHAQRYVANEVAHTYAVTPDDGHFLFLQPLSTPVAASGGALVLERNWLPAGDGKGTAR